MSGCLGMKKIIGVLVGGLAMVISSRTFGMQEQPVLLLEGCDPAWERFSKTWIARCRKIFTRNDFFCESIVQRIRPFKVFTPVALLATPRILPRPQCSNDHKEPAKMHPSRSRNRRRR